MEWLFLPARATIRLGLDLVEQPLVLPDTPDSRRRRMDESVRRASVNQFATR